MAEAGGVLGPLGGTNIRTFVAPEQPTRVGVLMDVPDLDAVMAAMESEEAAEAMAYDGCYPRPWCSWSSARSCLRVAEQEDHFSRTYVRVRA